MTKRSYLDRDDISQNESESLSALLDDADERAKKRARQGGAIWWGEVPTLVWIITRDVTLVADAIRGRWIADGLSLSLSVEKAHQMIAPRRITPDDWPMKDPTKALENLRAKLERGLLEPRRRKLDSPPAYRPSDVMALWPPISEAEPEPTPTSLYRTGFAGRSSALSIILAEARRRIEARERSPLPSSQRKFADELSKWLKATHHTDVPPAAPKTIENNPSFRDLWRNRDDPSAS